jgi:hypothetical protein
VLVQELAAGGAVEGLVTGPNPLVAIAGAALALPTPAAQADAEPGAPGFGQATEKGPRSWLGLEPIDILHPGRDVVEIQGIL